MPRLRHRQEGDEVMWALIGMFFVGAVVGFTICYTIVTGR